MMKQFLCLLLVTVLFFSCNDDEGNKQQFSQEAFLAAYSNTIATQFSALATKNSHYQTALNNFKANQNETNLLALQTAWEEFYSAYMTTNAYNFGEAGTQGIRKALVYEIDSYPTNATIIDEKIANQNFSVDDEHRNTRGLPAIEYIIFSDSSTIEGDKLQYLTIISEDINNRIMTVTNSWSSGYKNKFATNTGTNVTSSTAQFYNSWLQSISNLQSMKIGSPIGKYDSIINAMLVENYYSQTSLKHLKEHFASLYAIWQGENETGWRDYVASLPNGEAVKTKIDQQFETITSSMNEISDSRILADIVVNDTNTLDNLFAQLQQLEISLKTEASSLLGIAITATDQDGD